MKVGRFPLKVSDKKTICLLGSFESFHNGHLELLKKAKEHRKEISIMIFENPLSLPSNSNGEFQDLSTRLQNLANIGIDYVQVVKFDLNIASMTGNDFLNKLKENLNVVKFVAGADFALGKGRSLSVDAIQDADIVAHKKINGQKISTSILKESINLGDFKLIKELTPFAYKTKINVKGDESAIIPFSPQIHPGIYASFVILNNIKYPATLHVNQNAQLMIKVEELIIKNKDYEAIIEIHQSVRKIVKSSEDNMSSLDIKNSMKILSLI